MTFQTGRLKDIVSLNRRNLEIISIYNKREHFPIVDNKLLTKEYLRKAGIPYPATLLEIYGFFQVESAIRQMRSFDSFVAKPSRGRAGGGILILEKAGDSNWRTPSGRRVTAEELAKHMGDILFGVFSFGMTGDSVIVESRVYPHQRINDLYGGGIADIRVITFKNEPVMSMLRIPTAKSEGKANLHQGAIGIPIDIKSGVTGRAVVHGKAVVTHPDSGSVLEGIEIPFWKDILGMAVKGSEVIPMGYLGFDFVIDREGGPQVLEINARPGLQIQVVNRQGLFPLLFGRES